MASPAYKTVTPPATTIDALPTPPTMSGYTFGGWWSYTGGTGVQLTTSSTITSDVIVYAYWYKYQVTFQTDSTTVYATRGTIPPSTTVDYVSYIADQDWIYLRRLVYSCRWWWYSVFWQHRCSSSGITVYANWLPNTDTVYTVSYDGNGGTSIGAQYVIAPAPRPTPQWVLYQHLPQDCFTSLQAGTQRQMVVVIRLLPALPLQQVLQFMPNGLLIPDIQ